MPACDFTNVQNAIAYSAPSQAIVVSFVPMGQCRAHRFSFRVAQVRTRGRAVVTKLPTKSQLRWITLFVSSSTLLCCALPVILVSLGLGSVIASLNYNIPGLLFLAEHKLWTLSLSALLLLFLAWVIWRPNQACPTDPELAALCQKTKIWNQRIFWLSAIIWGAGIFFSYLLLPIRQTLG